MVPGNMNQIQLEQPVQDLHVFLIFKTENSLLFRVRNVDTQNCIKPAEVALQEVFWIF